MHFICRSFSANSESKSWSRFWENESDDPIVKSNKGHLFALINLNSSSDKELNSIGHDVSYEFTQNYFNSETNQDILINLQQSIDSVVKNPLYSDYTIDLLVAVVVDYKIYLATFGNCKIILKRQDKVSSLVDNYQSQTKTISGPIKSQDRIFLLTNSFYDQITWVKIKQFLSDPKIQNVEENFLSAVYSLDNQKNLAAAFIEIESDEQPQLVSEDNQQTTVFDSIIKDTPSKSGLLTFLKKIKKDKSVFIYQHQTKEVNKRKKITIVLIIVLLIGLIFNLFLGYQKNQSKISETKYQLLKIEIDKQIENINQAKKYNFENVSSVAKEVQNTLDQMVNLKIHVEEIENYRLQLQNFLNQTGFSENFTPELFFDLGNTVSNSQFQKIIINDNKLYLLDSISGILDYIDINQPSLKTVLSNNKIKSSLNIDFDRTNLYLLTADNIYLVEKNSLVPKIKFDNLKPIDFKFWNGAAYVLDAGNQTILKFTPNATGFSKAQNWIKDNIKLDSNASSISIDGKIWVLYQNGSINPYFSGVKSNFIPNQESKITQADNLIVATSQEKLAFIDNQKIVYIFQKSGELLSKYDLDKLQINDIAINESASLIYLLSSDQKIYSIKF